jgi:hypothetical protein
VRIFGYDLNVKRAENVVVKQPEVANIRRTITWEQQIQRIRQDIGKWRNAVKSAESIHLPNRFQLYQTYKDVVLDAHLSGALEQRTLNAIGSGWQVVDKATGERNEEKTKLLESEWFTKFLRYALDSKFWGHSLVDLGDNVDLSFPDIELVPRQYVKPEYGIVTQHTAGNVGVSYNDEPYTKWVVPIGEKRDLGLLMKASPYSIWKKNTLGSWNEHAEIFGSPLRIGRTDVRDEATRANMEAMLANMGAAAYGVFDKDDAVEFIDGAKRDAYRIYGNLVEFLNKEMSKLIIGQTMTLDDGSSRSQAEVHERVSKQIEQSDKEFLKSVVNGLLFPRLNWHKFGLENTEFVFIEKDSLSIQDQSKFDIELIKSGKYNIPDEYIMSRYGTPVEEVQEKSDEGNAGAGSVNNKGVNVNEFIQAQAERFGKLYS